VRVRTSRVVEAVDGTLYYVQDNGHLSPVIHTGVCPVCKKQEVMWNGRKELGPFVCFRCEAAGEGAAA
jgi:hypothetical protein